MKKGSFRIHVPEPCSENWQNMQATDDLRRYCATCDTTVVDFSQMSDDELIIYLSHVKGKVCGRFASTQINRSFRPVAPPKFSPRWWKSLLLLPLSFYAHQAAAQSRTPMQKVPRSLLFDKGNDPSKTIQHKTEDVLPVSSDSSQTAETKTAGDTSKSFSFEWKNFIVDSVYIPKTIIPEYTVTVETTLGQMVAIQDPLTEKTAAVSYTVTVTEGGPSIDSSMMNPVMAESLFADQKTNDVQLPSLPGLSVNNHTAKQETKSNTEKPAKKKEERNHSQPAAIPNQNDSRKKRK